MTASDIDLFDFLPEVAAERRAMRVRPLVDALTCLRDSVPDALEVVLRLEYWRRTDTRNPHKSGDWAYCVCAVGLRHEGVDHWARPTDGGRQGWDRTPVNLTTWSQLRDLVGADPRRSQIAQWANSLTAVDRWKDLYRPHELWPNPETWHPSYIEADHNRPGWDERLEAWRTVQRILTDAIETAVGTANVERGEG